MHGCNMPQIMFWFGFCQCEQIGFLDTQELQQSAIYTKYHHPLIVENKTIYPDIVVRTVSKSIP